MLLKVRSVLLPIIVAVAAASAAAWAGETPRVGPADTGVRTAAYNEWQVYELKGAYRAAMVIEFGAGEKIENVAIGDSAAWEASRYENMLFLKPRQKAAPTNAVVQTALKDGKLRVYNFRLAAEDAPAPDMMKIKFVYPGDISQERQQAAAERAARQEAERVTAQASSAIYTGTRNWAYSVTGSTAYVPAAVWDNGRATAFQFVGQTELPAIYAVDSEGNERLAPSHTQDNLVVVHDVAARWRVRSGGSVLCIYNEDFRPSWGPERSNGTGTSSWWRRIIGGDVQ